MIENNYNEELEPIELIKLKFIELKNSMIGKYFFLYFLHLNGILDYKEQGTECVFSNNNDVFNIPLPIIDSEEKYRELDRIHKNLEKFFAYLKSRVNELESIEIKLLDL